MLFTAFAIYAQQAVLKGKVVDAESGRPLSGVSVILRNQNSYAQTNNYGDFTLPVANTAGRVVLDFVLHGYAETTSAYNNLEDGTQHVGQIALKPAFDESGNGTVFSVDESQIDDEDGSSQTVGAIGNASDDIFLRGVGFTFSSMRFNVRGYDQNYQQYYINGVAFNDAERGRFNYSGIGGMNSTFKNRTVSSYTQSNDFAYGDLGGALNINLRSSQYAPGTAVSMAGTNRSYVMRAMATYATGLLPSGWAFNASAIYRWSKEGAWDGTFYNSVGYFLGAEKIFDNGHSLSLVTYGAPTQRGQQGPLTEEVLDLAGSIYYNPYWGYQNGEKRNSRVVESYDPTVIMSYEWIIDRKQKLNVGVAGRYNKYSSTALGFYNAVDPRPDYYRYLPSFTPGLEDLTEELWVSSPENNQINWDGLYEANARNNAVNPDGMARYMVEQRHNDLFESTFNANYLGNLTDNLKVTGGLEVKYTKGMHFKTMSDLLGANQWIDIDQFAERDFPANSSLAQNDLRNPNRIIEVGDKFGYDYDMNITSGRVFAQNDWTFDHYDFYYAAKLSATSFYRFGHMENGRAEAVGAISYGKGQVYNFIDPSFKAGFTWKIDGRNRLSVNGLAESRAPLASNSYISPRIKDTRIRNLQSEKILSYDLNYEFSYNWVKGRISGYRTHFNGASELLGYYDDGFRTFINNSVSNLNKVHQGIEAAARFKINNSWSVTAMGTFADYRYTSNGDGVMSAENGSFADVNETIYTDGLYVNAGPQIAVALQLNYFHPTMWFADITGTYYDKNYLDFAPNHYSESSFALYGGDKEIIKALATQEELPSGFMVNASVGKLIYLRNRSQSININLSLNNVLNNTNMKTGGFQQGRLPLTTTGEIDKTNLGKFPNKYYFAQGFNFYLNLGYKF